jgi:hypothetical protein
MFINTSNISKLSNKKISNNENDSSYTIGLSGNVYQGQPEILYTDIIYIQDTQQIWTHGVLYNCMANTKSIDADLTNNNINDREVKDLLDIITNERIYIKGHTDATYTNDGNTVSDVLDELYDQIAGKQKTLVSGTNIKTVSGKSILGSGDIPVNVQAVDTGDVLDDVNTNYATVAYVDGLVGDINSVLETIING